jgi:hypothetical protein
MVAPDRRGAEFRVDGGTTQVVPFPKTSIPAQWNNSGFVAGLLLHAHGGRRRREMHTPALLRLGFTSGTVRHGNMQDASRMEAPAIPIFRHGSVEHNFMDCYFVHRNLVDLDLRKNVFDRGAAACAIQLPIAHSAMRL